jgi:formylglycine-generating enzyme required for sulfatase activity
MGTNSSYFQGWTLFRLRVWQAVMGTNQSKFKGDTKRPVELVSWTDATNYCAKMTAGERAAGRLPAGYEYRLPTEAEWEYACRAGTTTATAYGNSLSSTQANFNGNSPYGGAANGPYLENTTKVGSYAPNAWGLYDMHGNVWEWCWDWYGPYPGEGVIDPRGPNTGSDRVLRGGGWGSIGGGCRSAGRLHGWPGIWYYRIGFRPVLAPGQ